MRRDGQALGSHLSGRSVTPRSVGGIYAVMRDKLTRAARKELISGRSLRTVGGTALELSRLVERFYIVYESCRKGGGEWWQCGGIVVASVAAFSQGIVSDAVVPSWRGEKVMQANVINQGEFKITPARNLFV
jgi:hypothetical protein